MTILQVVGLLSALALVVRIIIWVQRFPERQLGAGWSMREYSRLWRKRDRLIFGLTEEDERRLDELWECMPDEIRHELEARTKATLKARAHEERLGIEKRLQRNKRRRN